MLESQRLDSSFPGPFIFVHFMSFSPDILFSFHQQRSYHPRTLTRNGKDYKSDDDDCCYHSDANKQHFHLLVLPSFLLLHLVAGLFKSFTLGEKKTNHNEDVLRCVTDLLFHV